MKLIIYPTKILRVDVLRFLLQAQLKFHQPSNPHFMHLMLRNEMSTPANCRIKQNKLVCAWRSDFWKLLKHTWLKCIKNLLSRSLTKKAWLVDWWLFYTAFLQQLIGEFYLLTLVCQSSTDDDFIETKVNQDIQGFRIIKYNFEIIS